MAKSIHLFKCSCEDQSEMSFVDFKQHLAEKHNIKTDDELKGNRQMMCHMDMKKSYSSTYKWTLNNGFTFTEYFENSRSKSDIMYWD